MKNSKSIIAIIALAVVATTVAVVSCKKDDQNALNQKGYTIQQVIDIRQIEDPKAYFLDFKKKLTESKGYEALNLNDAAWHLACLANLDFCKVNVEYDDVQFDTVEMQLNVTEGFVTISDLNTAYKQMCAEILQFKKEFNHSDQNLYFINVSIGTNGNAKIALMTSYLSASKGLDEHLWYFPDTFGYIDSICDVFFTSDSTYLWDSLAASELERILNLFEHHHNDTLGNGIINLSYIPTQTHYFSYPNYSDPYGSPFAINSRVFAKKGDAFSSFLFILSPDDMCYCLDSYLGLGYDYLDNNSVSINEHPVCWKVIPKTRQFPNDKWWTYYHTLKVEYGRLIVADPPAPDSY